MLEQEPEAKDPAVRRQRSVAMHSRLSVDGYLHLVDRDLLFPSLTAKERSERQALLAKGQEVPPRIALCYIYHLRHGWTAVAIDERLRAIFAWVVDRRPAGAHVARHVATNMTIRRYEACLA